jgi:hypothetical protein
VVDRFDNDPAGRLPLEVPPSHRSCGMLMGPADSGVDVHVPGDQAVRIRLSLELGDDPCPGAVPLPAPEQVVDPVLRSVTLWHAPPLGPGSGVRHRMPSISCRRDPDRRRAGRLTSRPREAVADGRRRGAHPTPGGAFRPTRPGQWAG